MNKNISPLKSVFNVSLKAYNKYLVRNNDEWKASSCLPLSLSWSTLKNRMCPATENRTSYSSFDGVIKHPDENALNARNIQNTPIGKLMEARQKRINTANSISDSNGLSSLDPNTSMWEHTENSPSNSSEGKEELRNNIQNFYHQRIKDNDKREKDTSTTNVSGNESDTNTTDTNTTGTLYQKISRRRPKYVVVGGGKRVSRYSNEDTSVRRSMYNRSRQIHQRMNVAEENEYDEKSYINKRNYNSQANLMEIEHKKREIAMNNRRKEQKHANKVHFRHENRDDDIPQANQEIIQYSVNEDRPSTSPVFSSPVCKSDEKSSQDFRYNLKEYSEKKMEKLTNNKSKNFDEENDTGYTSVTTEPLFSPISGSRV